MIDKNKEMKPEKKQPKSKEPKPIPAEPKEPVCFTPSIVYTSENQHVIRQAVCQSNAVMIKEMTESDPPVQFLSSL